MSRLSCCFICLLLVCCLIVNISPIKAHATAAVAPVVSSVAAVSVPGALVVGAALIALGVYAGTKTETFEYLTQNAVNFLDTAGGWVKDGSMELLKTVNSVGKATYYVANDLLETLRGWIFSSDTINDATDYLSDKQRIVFDEVVADYFSRSSYSCAYCLVVMNGTSLKTISFSQCIPVLEGSRYTSYYTSGAFCGFTQYHIFYDDSFSRDDGSNSPWTGTQDYVFSTSSAGSYNTSLDLTIGTVSSVPIDGTSARDWSEEYADRRLYVVDSGGSGDPGDDDDGDHSGKWFWPLAGALTAGELYLLSQADEWSADTPSEFPEDDTKTDFDILDRPEVDGLPGIEISPVQDPAVDPNPDPDPDPDPNPDPDPTPDPDPDPDPDPEPVPDPQPDASLSGTVLEPFTLPSLRNFFPFCIPYDLYDMLAAFVAEPEAPVFTFATGFLGKVFTVDIDLSPWNSVAKTVRSIQLCICIVGLAFATRKFIKW